MKRFDVINQYIKSRGYKSYLEIGIHNPAHCFDRIQCLGKTGVDPAVESRVRVGSSLIQSASDDFFKGAPKGAKWDVIFIDGLHTYEQVKQDTLNALSHLNAGGVILLDDVAPLHPWLVRSREDALRDNFKNGWMGDVWRWGWEVCADMWGQGKPFDVYSLHYDHSLLVIDSHRAEWKKPAQVVPYVPEATFDDFLLVRPRAINLLRLPYARGGKPWAKGEATASPDEAFWREITRDLTPEPEPEPKPKRSKKKTDATDISDPAASGLAVAVDGAEA